MRASIIANPLKDTGYANAARAAETLSRAGVSVLAQPDAAEALGPWASAVDDRELFEGCDVIVTLGGDGTILSAARGARGRAPILGVNMGRKGFLTEVELPEMTDALKRVAAGDYTIENRMMLQAAVYDVDGTERSNTLALNDIYLSGAVSPRLVHVETNVGDGLVGRYAADGMLVSSPTGSTGYALSAGGPVVSPELRCLILTPVCAHTLSAVPLVLPAGDTVTLRAAAPTTELRMSADGEDRAHIGPGWRVDVTMAGQDALFVRFGRQDFFGLLKDKLVEWND